MTLWRSNELLFSAKCFAAGLLSLYLAMCMGLERPFWGMMTAYIVASPLSGTVRSKAVYRVCGTVLGSAMTVFIVPLLANAPELLTLALAVWVGGCLTVSLLDRTPRSYLFMLAGYTAALIGFSVVSNPASVFDIALARVEEITLGIICATLVHSLIFPASLGSALMARLDNTLSDARRWIDDVMSHTNSQHSLLAKRTLAHDITELSLMSTHLPFDTSHLRWTSNSVHALQDHLANIVALLSAIENRIAELHRTDPGSLSPGWNLALNTISDWIHQRQLNQTAAQLKAQIQALAPTITSHTSWTQLLQLNLIARLNALIDSYQESLDIRRHIHAVAQGGMPGGMTHVPGTRLQSLHRDHGIAALSGLATMIAIVACCAFWIATAWSSGATAAMMTAVFCCFFASQDDPAPSIKLFTKYTALSIPISALYLLALLPAIHSFEMLVLVFAPVFLVLGVYVARPSTGLQAMAILLGIFGMLSMYDTGPADLVSFINSMLAQMIGMLAALLFTGLLRSVSTQWTARRLLRTGWDELAELSDVTGINGIADSNSAPSISTVSTRMLDRIALLTPRLAIDAVETSAAHALADLRIGINIAQLRQMQTEMSQAGMTLQPLMHSLSAHFRELKQTDSNLPATAMLVQIDTLLRACCNAVSDLKHHQALIALTSLRCNIFPSAPAYQPRRSDLTITESPR